MLRRIRIVVPMLLLVGTVIVNTGNAGAAAPQAKWTVMVYMSGDNNLESYISTDLETELAVPGSSANVQVTALADRGPGYDKSHGDWQSTKLFHVTPGMTALPASAVADWGERDMGNPQTLVDFVNWSKTNYPADHYALYFWGHGWSWHPGVVMQDDTNAGSLDYHEMKPIMNTLGLHRRRRLRRLQHGVDRDPEPVARPRIRAGRLAGVGGLGRHRIRRRAQPARPRIRT